MKNANPGINGENIKLLRFIKRANLDVFWAKESGTVSTTFRDEKKVERLSKSLDLGSILPILEPFPVKDT